MARANAPWFRKSKKTWYTTLDGKRISLGVRGESNAKEVLKAWHRLMGGMPLKTPLKSLQPPPTPPAEVKLTTVQDVITAFLADAEQRMTPGCLRNYRIVLQPFADRYGARDAESLTISESEAFARKPEWLSSYHNGMLGSLITAYRWAESWHVINRNPLHGTRIPGIASQKLLIILHAGVITNYAFTVHDEGCRAIGPFRVYVHLERDAKGCAEPGCL